MADKKILLVEDEADVLLVLKEGLSREGYQLFIANDGEEALKKAEQILPDLIVLDILLPRLDGWEVCKRLKSNLLTRPIPVLILTVTDPRAGEWRSNECGADAFLSKEAGPDVLHEKVRSLLGG